MSVVAKFLLLLVSSVLISLLPAFANGQLPTPLNAEVLGLIVFKSALEDPTAALASWSETDAPPCGWAHVECDPATSHVLRLTLDSLSLSGPLPRGLDRLPFLESLSISNNDLSGEDCRSSGGLQESPDMPTPLGRGAEEGEGNGRKGRS